MTRTGRILRATVFRAGKKRRVWIGMGWRIRLVVDPGAPLHKYIGTAEWELAKWIKRFTERGTLCFDVGGYDAHVAMILARRTRARVCCFEPEEERVARIRENLKMNPTLANHVRVVPTFVSDRTRLDPREDTLDDLIAQGRVVEPDFLKIDVEGQEMGVLRGAAKLLAERKPHVLLEIHSNRLALECLVYLEELGYKPDRVPQRRWLKENRGTGPNEWMAAYGQSRAEADARREMQMAGAEALTKQTGPA